MARNVCVNGKNVVVERRPTSGFRVFLFFECTPKVAILGSPRNKATPLLVPCFFCGGNFGSFARCVWLCVSLCLRATKVRQLRSKFQEMANTFYVLSLLPRRQAACRCTLRKKKPKDFGGKSYNTFGQVCVWQSN